jgi:hypothetical protein
MTSLRADVVFCDEIRQEITGKFIMIGAYPGDLIPGTIPGSFPMAVFLRVHGLAGGPHQFSFKVMNPSAEVAFAQEGEVNLEIPDFPMVLIFSGFPMIVTRPGEISAEIEVDGTKLQAGKIRVMAPPQIPSN